MDKKPLVPISHEPIDIWYESPSVMIVNKPSGLKVYPDNTEENNTLVNRLFQHNRWLAGMESSMKAGILHLFEPEDHGLMLFNKSDDYGETLKRALSEKKISFSYIVHTKENPAPHLSATDESTIEFKSSKKETDLTMLDISTTEGNTKKLRENLFPGTDKDKISFFCYEIELVLPHTNERHITSIRDTEKGLPHITVYHAPP